MSALYLIVLAVSLASMVLIDKRFSLALFKDRTRTLIAVAIGVAVFIFWDALGIGLGIFFSGHSPYMSGIYLAPEFPIEELFFLTFLCYFTLIMYNFFEARS